MAEREVFEAGEEVEEEEETPPASPRKEEDADGLPFWELLGYAVLAGVGLMGFFWVVSVMVDDHLTIGRLEKQMTEQTDKVEILTNSVSDLTSSVNNLNGVTNAHEEAISSLRTTTYSLRTATEEALEKAVAAGKTGASADKIARSVRKDLAAYTAGDSARWVRADSLREEIADRQFRADSAIVVSRANLAAVERKADGVAIRADSLDAARQRHETALADLRARMDGKKKKVDVAVYAAPTHP